VFGVVRPDTALANWRRGNDGPVAVAGACEVNDREKVAVVSVFVSGPGKEISSRRTLGVIGGLRRMLRAGKYGDSDDGESKRASQWVR
jgi:hypothetical protein